MVMHNVTQDGGGRCVALNGPTGGGEGSSKNRGLGIPLEILGNQLDQ